MRDRVTNDPAEVSDGGPLGSIAESAYAIVPSRLLDVDVHIPMKGILRFAAQDRKPKHIDIDGTYAYVVIPSEYSFKRQGKPVKEKDSAFTFALKKGPAGWKITGWSWAKN